MPSALRSPRPDGEVDPAPPVLDVTVPVHNEEAELERCVRTLRAHLDAHVPYPAVITVADNASTDATLAVATRLGAELPGVRVLHLDQKGRGRALRAAWSTSRADVVAYMDVDLATDLGALLPLVASLVSGHSDVAIGSRLAPGARVRRGAKREVISRSYNLLLRLALRAQFSDAQCGFKAVRADVARALLPLVDDQAWFFDTELLAVAEHTGLRIHEVPVDWTDDPDSRVDVASTALADLRGTWRLWRCFAQGALPAEPLSVSVSVSERMVRSRRARFAGIGGASTVAYLVGFLILQPFAGTLAANALALSACAIGNAAAHRRLGGGDEEPLPTAATLLASGLALSSAVLAAAGAVSGSLAVAVVAMLGCNAVVSAARVVLRRNAAYRAHLARRG